MRSQSRRLVLVVILILAPQIQAHKVPVGLDDPSLNFLRNNGKGEIADGVAEYCGRQGVPVPICVNKLKETQGVEEAAKCNAKIKGGDMSVDPTILDQKGGMWHPYPAESKEDKVHWHTFTEEIRRAAGTNYASYMVRLLKEGKEDISKSVEVSGKTDLGPTEVGGSVSETKKGPTQAQINEAYYKGYVEGYNNPLTPHTDVTTPDAYCIAGESYCRTALGLRPDPDRLPRDKSYVPLSFYGPKEEWAALERSHEPPPKPTSPQSVDIKDPTKDPSIANPQSKDPKDSGVNPLPSPPAEPKPGKVEGPCGGNIKGYGICDYETAGYALSPLEECVQDEMQKKNALTTKTTESGPDEGSLKKQAEENLKLGYCMEEYYGAAFCKKFNQKQITTVDQPSGDAPYDGGYTQDPQEYTSVDPNTDDNIPF